MDPGTLAAMSNGMDLFGRVFGAFSAIQEGKEAEARAKYEAAQLRQNAGQAMAASQREAITAEQQAKRITSRALAVAAASGGGASDPTVVRLIADTAGEGAYRQAVALYEGQERARSLEMQADAALYEGKLARRAATRNAIGSLIGAGSSAAKAQARSSAGAAQGESLRNKYGGTGPGTASWGRDLGYD